MNNAMDDRDNSRSLMASWYSYFVYYGRIYPYSYRGRDNCYFSKNNQWKKYTLAGGFYINPRSGTLFYENFA